MKISANTPPLHSPVITPTPSTAQHINSEVNTLETARTDMRANSPTEEMSNFSKIAMSSTGIAVTAATVTLGLPMMAACTTLTPILAIATASGASVGGGLTAAAYPWVSEKPSGKGAIEPILTGAVASGALLADNKESEEETEQGSSQDQQAPKTTLPNDQTSKSRGTQYSGNGSRTANPIQPQLLPKKPIPGKKLSPVTKPVRISAPQKTQHPNTNLDRKLQINLVDLADRVYYEAPYSEGVFTKIVDFFDTTASSKTHQRRRIKQREKKLEQKVGNFKLLEQRNFDHYYAASYKDDKNKKIVVSFRGTDNPNDVFLKDASGIGLENGHSKHLLDPIKRSVNFTRSMRKKYEKSGYEVRVTGHSLGGYYAQRVGQATGVRGMSFNAPGTGTERNPKNKNDFINIRMDKDPVSRFQASNHYGEVIALQTPKNKGAHQIETCMIAMRRHAKNR